MNWYKLSYKMKQSSAYGYWLLPDGDLIQVGETAHVEALRKKNLVPLETASEDLYNEAFRKGLIRIITGYGRLDIELGDNHHINDSQKYTLINLYKELNNSSLDIIPGVINKLGGFYKAFNNLMELVRIIVST